MSLQGFSIFYYQLYEQFCLYFHEDVLELLHTSIGREAALRTHTLLFYLYSPIASKEILLLSQQGVIRFLSFSYLHH